MSASTVKVRRREVRRALGEDAAVALNTVLERQDAQEQTMLRLVRALEGFVTQGFWRRLMWLARGSR